MPAMLPKTYTVSGAPLKYVSHEEHSVVVKHLPRQMRSLPMVKVVLEQVGIDGDVTSCHYDKKHDFIVSFKSARAALVCVKHFNGRRWSGPSAPAVVAEMVPCSAERNRLALPSDGQRSPTTLKEILKLNPPPSFFRPPPGLSLVPTKDHKAVFCAGMMPHKVQKERAQFVQPSYDDDYSTDAGSSQDGDVDCEVSIFL
eukprot:TRINITY_DN3175_c0_g4_i1.p1 TRINITY_DN3175_c0_g4~~TRINITY_DN3175_c0_g4_i1.p1  ORF type:complete len:199 (-),score=41.32 TRINITY_DN3175_c0_g4_i1:410-1006(-)